MPASSAARSTRLYPDLALHGTGGICNDRRIHLGLCGEQKTWIIGVNWYLNDYVRLMFDYAQADLSGYPLTAVASGTSLALDGPATIAGFDGANGQRLRHARPESTGKNYKTGKAEL